MRVTFLRIAVSRPHVAHALQPIDQEESPGIVHGWLLELAHQINSSAAYEVHDFQFVSIFQVRLRPAVAGNDFAVEFDGDPVWLHAELSDQCAQSLRRCRAGLAVDGQVQCTHVSETRILNRRVRRESPQRTPRDFLPPNLLLALRMYPAHSGFKPPSKGGHYRHGSKPCPSPKPFL